MRDALLRPLLLWPVARQFLPAINALRAQEGLAALHDLRSMVEVSPLLLFLTAEPFEYPRSDWPTNVRTVGPCAWEPPSDPPAWLADIDAPIVLVTTSSEFQDDRRLADVALEALADETSMWWSRCPRRPTPRRSPCRTTPTSSDTRRTARSSNGPSAP